jgi:hypothetical protein
MRSKKLVLFAVAAAFVVAALPAAAGCRPQTFTLAFTGDASCLTSPANFGPDLNALGATSIMSFSSTGTFTFNAPDWRTLAGSGTASFKNVGFDNGGGTGYGYAFSQSVSLPFTYTVGSDGALTITPGTLTITWLTGPSTGTFTKSGLAPFAGQISWNGTIVLTSSTTGVETIYNSLGIAINYQACHRTRTLVPVFP